MKQVISRLRIVGLRQIITICLAMVTFLAIPAFNQSASFQAQAGVPNILLADYGNPVTPETVKRIQEKAEDLGDRPGKSVGDTGLENIKQLGEKIPKVIDLNVRQQGAKYNPNESNKIEAIEKAQEKVDND